MSSHPATGWGWVSAGCEMRAEEAGEAEKRRRRRLFQTTKTEDRVMVAAARMGLRKPSAASGMASTL